MSSGKDIAASDGGRLHAWVRSLPDASLESRSEVERTIVLVYKFELAWCNGGLEHFFEGPLGDKWQETLDAFHQLGATRIARILAAATAVFPGSSLAENQMVRSEQMEKGGLPAEETLRRLDDEYCSLHKEFPAEDSYTKMIEYLRSKGEI